MLQISNKQQSEAQTIVFWHLPSFLPRTAFFCQVAQIVKREMESAVKLYVKLKAKVKVGSSWGNLQDLDL